MTTNTFNISDFTRVQAGGAVRVDITRGTGFKVKALADDFSYIYVEKIGDRLVLGRRGFDWLLPFHLQPEFYIEMPDLQEVKMSGATRGQAAGFQMQRSLNVAISGASHFDLNDMTVSDLNIDISGASHLKGNIQCTGKAELDISGASHIDLTGTAKDLVLHAVGACQADLSSFTVQNAGVGLSGASHAMVNLNGRLDTRLYGASNLRWLGSPIMGEMEIAGASSIHHN